MLSAGAGARRRAEMDSTSVAAVAAVHKLLLAMQWPVARRECGLPAVQLDPTLVGYTSARSQIAGFLFGTAYKRTKESCNAVKTILPSRTCNNRMQAATRVIAALRPLQALATKGKLLLLQALAHRLVSIRAVQR